MLSLDDPRWDDLEGGYRDIYNPVPELRKLEQGEDVWPVLWENLHHQGDVGEASYAAVPHLIRIGKMLPARDYNLYALVSTIEIERHREGNPPLPRWLEKDYDRAWSELFELALRDIVDANDSTDIRAIIGAIAVAKGLLKYGELLAFYSEDEINEILEKSF